ncbi:hypothetical protein [Flavobacterium maritimum]|uniref:hypothetical protein n=1 Tax=Flavobacterium maritimum TaxID=3149042 RepID=UPI0032B50E22
MEFKSSYKTTISDRNIEEIRGWVINEMNKIESKINDIIIHYFEPIDKDKFKKIILNSSIISVGGKIKILGNIENFDRKIIDKIMKLSSIRNSFAHIPILVHFDIEKIEDSEGGAEYKLNSFDDKIEVMSSSGKLESKFVREELEKFESLKNEITDYINNYC